MEKKNIVAICGSTRQESVNKHLIKAIEKLFTTQLSMQIFEGIADLPHFNPDSDNDLPPIPVQEFRNLLKHADGILVCMPEYAMGVPGTLKNAIDWTVSSMEFSGKPTLLITASLSGEKGHQSLLETLKVIEAGIKEETQLVISFAKTKINSEEIIDLPTKERVTKAVLAFIDSMDKKN